MYQEQIWKKKFKLQTICPNRFQSKIQVELKLSINLNIFFFPTQMSQKTKQLIKQHFKNGT